VALKGTLTDLGIVDLVQLPHVGRKTGQLVVTSPAGEAQLFYVNGAMVHARVGEYAGIDALSWVVDWREGSFEFQLDAVSPDKTISHDLPRTVMEALRLRDDRKLEDARRQAEEEARRLAEEEARRLAEEEAQRLAEEEARRQAEAGVRPRASSVPPRPVARELALERKLEAFLNATAFAQHGCVLSFHGDLRAEATRAGVDVEGLEELRAAVHALYQSYPRPGLQRFFLDDRDGLTVVVRLADGGILLLVADRSVPLGAILVGAGRIASELDAAPDRA
jgi:hypothetical protein